ncbi:MAG: phosphoserine phosphatase SerB [Pseudomonadota bacterium]
MERVVTLVAPEKLDPDVVAKVVEALEAPRAARLGSRATDIFVAHDDAAAVAAAALGGAAIDVIVQPVAGRQKRLLLSDMDSTLIAQECIDELAGVIGAKDEVSAITARAMRGEIDFAGALNARVALLKGTPAGAIDDLLGSVITLSPGAEVMTATLAARGVRTVLVSGGFMAFADAIAARLQMAAAFANRLEVADGVLTGRVVPPILGADAKRERLLAECAALGIAPGEAVALGDGANDLAMIKAAGLGIAYRAKPAVAAAADASIAHTDLTTVLFALGVHEDEFVSP